MSHSMHQTIAAIVQAIEPCDQLEAAHQEQTLAWIASGAPLCRIAKPATPPQHLVSYFMLFDQAQRQILLVDHINAGLWLPSGGHVEPDEHPKTTVEREVGEELQIAADFWRDAPLFITVTQTVGSTAGHTDVSLWYVLRGNANHAYDFDRAEFHAIRWFDLPDLPLDRCDPHLARFAAKLQAHA